MRVLRRGRRINSSFFTIYFIDSPKEVTAEFRGAVVVGLKVSKKATERNCAKRRMHAAIREYRRNQKLVGDFIFVLKKEIISLDYQQIKTELTKCLNNSLYAPSIFIKKLFRQTTVFCI